MVSTARVAAREQGITIGTVILASIFFLTAMRFFIGNQLHLQSEDIQRISGLVWFYDLLIIVFETTLLIFLAGLVSLDANAASPLGFFGLLIWIYAVDIVWISTQYIFGKISRIWRREFIPWEWGLLNSILIVLTVVVYYVFNEFYSTYALVILGVLNGLGFVIDIALVDKYKML